MGNVTKENSYRFRRDLYELAEILVAESIEQAKEGNHE